MTPATARASEVRLQPDGHPAQHATEFVAMVLPLQARVEVLNEMIAELTVQRLLGLSPRTRTTFLATLADLTPAVSATVDDKAPISKEPLPRYMVKTISDARKTAVALPLEQRVSAITRGLSTLQPTRLCDVHPRSRVNLSSQLNSMRDVMARLVELDNEKDAFVERYQIQRVGPCKVSFSLFDVSPIEFLDQVQRLSYGLYQRPHTNPQALEAWRSEASFNDLARSGTHTHIINGRVSGSSNLSREAQCGRGWNNVGRAVLAAAHGAYFIVTGRDLFGAQTARAADGALSFMPDGNLHDAPSMPSLDVGLADVSASHDESLG